MAELLKNIYNRHFIQTYTKVLKNCDITQIVTFEKTFGTLEWEKAELKGRMAILARETEKLLPHKWEEKYKTLRKIVGELRKEGVRDQNLEFIFLADIVANGAKVDLLSAFSEIEFITQFVSFEFAGRSLLINNQELMMAQMEKWASHSHPNVRRYASEGCRPLLPWGIQLKSFRDNPRPLLPILEILKNDDSLYVRKSVANNLNDISKFHPALVLEISQKWYGPSTNTNWIVKQALRTLLKNGDTQALALTGYDINSLFEMSEFEVDKTLIELNDFFNFSFYLKNLSSQPSHFRIEYTIYFLKNNGKHNKKVFRVSSKTLPAHEKVYFVRKHMFKNRTTRQHYVGEHFISLVINGQESQKLSFNLQN